MTLHRTRKLDIYVAIKELMDENKGYPLSGLCRIADISRAAYYKWLNHIDSDNDKLNDYLAQRVSEIHGEHPDMGYRRIRDTIEHDDKINVNDKRILRICRKKKVQSVIKHKMNCCTKPASDPAYTAENVLNQEFRSDTPNEKWVTDVSVFKYGTTIENTKKVYLSAILDLCGKRPVSFAVSDYNDNELVFRNFDDAVAKHPDAHPLFHSDRGYQYTSKAFHDKLEQAGMVQSMSRVAHCIDNGPMEGFWGVMKREMYYGKKFKTKEELIAAISNYMDYYVNKRVQRRLGVMTPSEYYKMKIAA
ncbi:MAG: IS3 family transposase [Caldicoprobacterales bacterium]